MKKIKSIQRIFILFLAMIIAGFFILYRYSKESLKDSLTHVAQIQMEHSSVLLEQKIKEIEIEADGILHSQYLKSLQLILDNYNVYNYVISVNEMKEYLGSRQKSTVGMSAFLLFWPESARVISTTTAYTIDREVLRSLVENNQWFTYENDVYFVARYTLGGKTEENQPYLIIKMDRDYLYKIKNMAFGMRSGGTLLTFSGCESLFPVNEVEEVILSQIIREEGKGGVSEVMVYGQKYQVLTSYIAKNGMGIISYYPIRRMLKPVNAISWITGISLLILLLLGFLFMLLYYKNILLQLRIITEKLKQVENGNFAAKIDQLPDNEFSYVFEQFNQMVTKIRGLIDSEMKEQQLRHQAELRQLQLQINPHFLYNSLSYIVTVAEKPDAVTEMAVHLAYYYRYCTVKKSITTIGEEVSYAKAYLSIMAMRRRIEYEISVPEKFYNEPIIPLILQPIIENAIEHAIEERENAKHIYVKAYSPSEKGIQFEISDDGDGLSAQDIETLMKRLKRKRRKEDESVGLWNVNQRLVNYYDEASGLRFRTSIWGGLTVSFIIDTREGRIVNDSIDCG